MTCPICTTVLVDSDPGQRSCPRCRGTWIGHEALAQLLVAARRGAGAEIAFEPLPAGTAGKQARGCPTCAQTMGAGTLVGVLVDRCVEHGVWVDAGELSRIVLAARRSG